MNDPQLSRPYPVSGDQQRSYRENGFILLKDILSGSDLRRYRDAILKVIHDVSAQKDSQGRISDYSAMFTQVTNAWRLDETVKAFVFAERFARIAADLMGVTGVRLYHDQALVKEPGGKATPWHQDQYYWPLDTDSTVTMWMPLVDVTPEMGSMSFVPGSHTNKDFQRMAISDTSQAYFENFIRESGAATPSFSLKAGDATFHSGWTLHAAHANQSTVRREVMTVIYFADGTRLLEPDNEHRKVDMQVFLPGRAPGDAADSDLNPLLCSSSPR